MGSRKVRAIEHTCDHCHSVQVTQLDEPAYGFSMHWVEISGTGGNGGSLWACSEGCMLSAFKRRHDIAEEQRRGE